MALRNSTSLLVLPAATTTIGKMSLHLWFCEGTAQKKKWLKTVSFTTFDCTRLSAPKTLSLYARSLDVTTSALTPAQK
jgi:flagellar biosynthesis GTPase FlhF